MGLMTSECELRLIDQPCYWSFSNRYER